MAAVRKSTAVFKKVSPHMKKHGEDYLDQVEDIRIKLENGTEVVLQPREELRVPTGPDEIRDECREGPSRLAFWAYQENRALSKVRTIERELAKLEGQTNLVYRKFLTDEGEPVTESIIRSRVDIETEVETKRIQLNAAQTNYGFIRATRDALEHRMYVLRKLVANDAEVNRG